MNIKRRQFLALGGIGLLGTSCAAVANKIDGIGPNRGIAERTFRNKHTCVNSDVLESDISTRLSKPDDFGNSACKMIEDSFEGPYFTCTPSTGKDIATGQAGQPLTMALRLVDQDCKPIPNGVVDIWACNADGYYAGYSNDPNEMPPIVRAVLFGHVKPDTEDRFCRGALRTDADGIAEFNSVYPGFYYGQPIHVHFKAHVDGKNLLTTQANFPEDWNQKVMKLAPYNKPRTIERNAKSSGFPIMSVMERAGQMLAVLDLMLPYKV